MFGLVIDILTNAPAVGTAVKKTAAAVEAATDLKSKVQAAIDGFENDILPALKDLVSGL